MHLGLTVEGTLACLTLKSGGQLEGTLAGLALLGSVHKSGGQRPSTLAADKVEE